MRQNKQRTKTYAR